MREIIVEDWNKNHPLVMEQGYNEPTKIWINGRRVTEPTQLIHHGEVLGTDMADQTPNVSIPPTTVGDRA